MIAVFVLAPAVGSCEPDLDIGAWRCADAPLFLPPDGSPVPAGRDTVVELEWTSGFEDGFCGFSNVRGFCYGASGASRRIVEAPAHSGRRAAAFTVNSDDELRAEQTRCVREGLLPKDAYYRAYFFIPSGTTNNGNWNLMHFRTAGEDGALDGRWDVSLVTTEQGTLAPWLRDYVGGSVIPPSEDYEVPVDRWFSLAIRLRRDSTEAGVAALYLDDELVVERTDIVTDVESTWGQWYVGNLATDISPSESTIYLDDVSISASLSDAP